MRLVGVTLALLFSSTYALAQFELSDADTLILDGTKYRLDAIDAPELDQNCRLPDGKLWPCGEAATAALTQFIAGRPVRCDDVGEDRKYQRRVGQCWVGEVSIEHWLVREGWAIEFKMHSYGQFAEEQLDAREHQRGIWATCFADPRDHRYSNKSGATLLGQCPSDSSLVRDQLFGRGLFIKAKVYAIGRQILTGLKGIYHTEGCRSYGKMANEPDGQRLVFFASPALAEEAGFRKAKNCTTRTH